MFTQQDIAQIEARGLSVAEVEKQIENFRKGFPALPVVRAAAGGDGVKQLTDEELKAAEALYEAEVKNLKTIEKFWHFRFNQPLHDFIDSICVKKT